MWRKITSQNWSPTFSKGPYIKRRLLIVDSWFVSITRWISIGWSSAWNTWLKQANIYHLCNFQLGVPKHPSKPIPAKSLFALHHTSGIIHHILHTILRSIKTLSPILGKGPLPIQLRGVDIQNCGTYPRLGKYPVFESCVGRYATWLATPNEFSNQLVSWSPRQWGISGRVPVCVSTWSYLVHLLYQPNFPFKNPSPRHIATPKEVTFPPRYIRSENSWRGFVVILLSKTYSHW